MHWDKFLFVSVFFCYVLFFCFFLIIWQTLQQIAVTLSTVLCYHLTKNESLVHIWLQQQSVKKNQMSYFSFFLDKENRISWEKKQATLPGKRWRSENLKNITVIKQSWFFFFIYLFPSQLERSTLIILKLSVKLSGKVSQR